ncbi:MAG: hypothetical protein U0Q07_16725 [Acidimicrobiales bacterium]
MNAAGWTISIIAIATALVVALRWELSSRTSERPALDRYDGSRPHLEFMSAPWIAMARHEITTALSRSDLDIEPYTLSEEFTDPPPHLGHGSDRIGFSIRVGRGRVEVDSSPTPDADCRVISDYADALVIARDPDTASADPAEAERRIANVRLRIEGDPAGMPPQLQQLDIHRLLASRTA